MVKHQQLRAARGRQRALAMRWRNLSLVANAALSLVANAATGQRMNVFALELGVLLGGRSRRRLMLYIRRVTAKGGIRHRSTYNPVKLTYNPYRSTYKLVSFQRFGMLPPVIASVGEPHWWWFPI